MKLKRESRDGVSFLSPDTCGSSIRYIMSVKQVKSESRRDTSFYVEASSDIYLTDCDKQIKWSGYSCSNYEDSGIEEMRDKVKNAIECLEKYLIDLDELENTYKEYEEEVNEINKIINKGNSKDE